MTGPSSPARQAAIDAALIAYNNTPPDGPFGWKHDRGMKAAVDAALAVLAGPLFIAATPTGDDTVYRLAEPGPYVPDDPADPAAWEELDGRGPLSTRMPAEVWEVVAAVLSRVGEARSDGEAGESESTFEQRFPDWDRSNFMVAGRYFDSELAPTYGRVPDDISAEHLEKQRQQYVASAASNLDAAAELQEWDRRRRGKA